MAIRVALNHNTSYRYDRLVTLSPQVVRLRPAPHCRTPILSLLAPASSRRSHFVNWQQDPQGNFLARLVFPEKATSCGSRWTSSAEMTVINPFDFFLEPEAEQFPFRYAELAAAPSSRPFLRGEPADPRFAAYLDGDAAERAAHRSTSWST